MITLPRCNGFFTAVESVVADGVYKIRIETPSGCMKLLEQERLTGDRLDVSTSDLTEDYIQTVTVFDPADEEVYRERVKVTA